MKVESENSDCRLYAFQFVVTALLILLAASVRILPHPMNFTPVGAMAIFSGSLFRNRWAALSLPLAALFAGDLFVGLYKLMFIVYVSFALSVAIGRWLAPWRRQSCLRASTQSPTVARIAGAVFLGALQFFVDTNFAMWALSDFYPKTSAGLAACFINAIPYFWNTLAGDGLYAAALFGGFALAEKFFRSTATLGCAE